MIRKPFTAEVIVCDALKARSFATAKEAKRFARRMARRHAVALAVWKACTNRKGRVVSHRLVKIVDPPEDNAEGRDDCGQFDQAMAEALPFAAVDPFGRQFDGGSLEGIIDTLTKHWPEGITSDLAIWFEGRHLAAILRWTPAGPQLVRLDRSGQLDQSPRPAA